MTALYYTDSLPNRRIDDFGALWRALAHFGALWRAFAHFGARWRTLAGDFQKYVDFKACPKLLALCESTTPAL